MLSLEACSKSTVLHTKDSAQVTCITGAEGNIICGIFKPNFYDEYTTILISEKKVVIVNIVMV